MSEPIRILIADDDQAVCEVLADIVESLGYETQTVHRAQAAVDAARNQAFDLVLLDINFPDCNDLSALTALREQAPQTDVIMVTAQSRDLSVVKEATRLGAFDYVPKPIQEDDIRIRVTRLLEMRRLRQAHARAVSELARGSGLDDIVGCSHAVRAIVAQVKNLAHYDIPSLITGETGTGKELVAQALHYSGPRWEEPFVSINCAALPTSLVESELFGHEKGAFTGAHRYRRGAIEEAGTGTLFLDEVGDMDLTAQAALLRVLETGEYRTVGGQIKTAQARMILATNQDLETLIDERRFRKDLFYRINRMVVRIPPLRERKEDIPLLAKHFLYLIDQKVGKGVTTISPEVLEAFAAYDWPGNVRELRNEVERLFIYTPDDGLHVLDVSIEIMTAGASRQRGEEADPQTLEDLSRLVQALRTCGGNVTRAAKMLGVHRNTVHRWMKRYSLERD